MIYPGTGFERRGARAAPAPLGPHRDYAPGNPDWIQGVVLEQSSTVSYAVEVILNRIRVLWMRHVDQIKTWAASEESWSEMTTPVDVGKEVFVPETMMPDVRAKDPVP